VKHFRSFNFFSSLNFRVQGVHIFHKVCIDRGEVTLGKIKRDSVEPSSTEVQSMHRKELCFEFREDKTTGGSVEALPGGHRASAKSA
jgi:hypothetical protein